MLCKQQSLIFSAPTVPQDMNSIPNIERVISQGSNSMPIATLTAPYDYLQLLPSNNNNFRSKFLTGFNERFLHISDKKLITEIGSIIDTFHAASLLIDDIEDGSEFRRGKPCAHINYGIPATINTGNMMYFIAMQRALRTLPSYNSPKVLPQGSSSFATDKRIMDIFVEEMVNLHIGQGYDIHWRDNLRDIMKSGLPSIEKYLQVAMHKTGGLFRLAVRILIVFGENEGTESGPLPESMIRLANLFGIIYQVRDDYLNLVDERYAKMKGFQGEDLVEGKLSLPILYTLHFADKNSVLHRFYAETTSLSERKADPERLEQVRNCIAHAGALTYTYSLLQQYIERAKAVITSSDGVSSQGLSDLLATLSQVSNS